MYYQCNLTIYLHHYPPSLACLLLKTISVDNLRKCWKQLESSLMKKGNSVLVPTWWGCWRREYIKQPNFCLLQSGWFEFTSPDLTASELTLSQADPSIPLLKYCSQIEDEPIHLKYHCTTKTTQNSSLTTCNQITLKTNFQDWSNRSFNEQQSRVELQHIVLDIQI